MVDSGTGEQPAPSDAPILIQHQAFQVLSHPLRNLQYGNLGAKGLPGPDRVQEEVRHTRARPPPPTHTHAQLCLGIPELQVQTRRPTQGSAALCCQLGPTAAQVERMEKDQCWVGGGG